MATLYLVVGSTPCWKCEARLVVPSFGVVGWREEDALALADPDDAQQMLLLRYADELPEPALQAARKIQPRYELQYSQTMDLHYFMTICSCGAPQGDHYLHKPGDGPFFPLGEREARDLLLLELDAFQDDAFYGEPSGGVGSTILRQGTHCATIEELWIAARALLRTNG